MVLDIAPFTGAH